MCGTGAEIAKNIILAGVHSVTVADFEKVYKLYIYSYILYICINMYLCKP